MGSDRKDHSFKPAVVPVSSQPASGLPVGDRFNYSGQSIVPPQMPETKPKQGGNPHHAHIVQPAKNIESKQPQLAPNQEKNPSSEIAEKGQNHGSHFVPIFAPANPAAAPTASSKPVPATMPRPGSAPNFSEGRAEKQPANVLPPASHGRVHDRGFEPRLINGTEPARPAVSLPSIAQPITSPPHTGSPVGPLKNPKPQHDNSPRHSAINHQPQAAVHTPAARAEPNRLPTFNSAPESRSISQPAPSHKFSPPSVPSVQPAPVNQRSIPHVSGSESAPRSAPKIIAGSIGTASQPAATPVQHTKHSHQASSPPAQAKKEKR